MTVFPHAKINIGLFITEKRTDGFHNIETVFYPVPLTDILDIEKTDSAEKITFEYRGFPLPDGDSCDNLCCKAYRLLDEKYDLPPVKISLCKNIPVGAGLGGGSSDAAFTLQVIDDLFGLKIGKAGLAQYAGYLGSDCPFFLHNQPMIGKGRGELLESIPLSLKGYHILLVKPPVSVSTAEAYAAVKPRLPEQSLEELVNMSVKGWRNVMVNDFEASIFMRYPEIKQIKDTLYDLGADYASLSGSGSALYGLFHQPPATPGGFFPECFTWQGLLR